MLYVQGMAYDPELPGCFGERDLIFASHELDRERAFAWLAKLRKQETVWVDVEAQIKEYLRERGAAVFQITDQIEKAVASLSEHRRYLELLSDTAVEEQARQIVDMIAADEDGRRKVGFRLYWG